MSRVSDHRPGHEEILACLALPNRRRRSESGPTIIVKPMAASTAGKDQGREHESLVIGQPLLLRPKPSDPAHPPPHRTRRPRRAEARVAPDEETMPAPVDPRIDERVAPDGQ